MDVRTRISEYDRMRTQNLRMKNLMKRSLKLKEQLKNHSKNQIDEIEKFGVYSPNRTKRGRSASPQKAFQSSLVIDSKVRQHTFVDPSMFW